MLKTWDDLLKATKKDCVGEEMCTNLIIRGGQ